MAMMRRQENVWDRDYRHRGRLWSKNVIGFPEVLHGKSVLEAGAGSGKTLRTILEQGPSKVVAIDFSAEAIRICETAFEDSAVVSFGKADITALPFEDAAFDAVVTYYVLDNLLLHGREDAVGEVRRVLKPGGLVLFEDFAVGDFRERTGNVEKMIEPHTPLKKNGLVCHYFYKEEVMALFKGFVLNNFLVREFNPIRGRNHMVRRIIRAMFERPIH